MSSSYLFDLLAGVLLLEELQVELLLLLLVKLLQVLLQNTKTHTHTEDRDTHRVSKPGWKRLAMWVVKLAAGRQVFTGLSWSHLRGDGRQERERILK